MKKVRKMLTALSAVSLLFMGTFIGCSSDGGGSEPGPAPEVEEPTGDGVLFRHGGKSDDNFAKGKLTDFGKTEKDQYLSSFAIRYYPAAEIDLSQKGYEVSAKVRYSSDSGVNGIGLISADLDEDGAISAVESYSFLSAAQAVKYYKDGATGAKGWSGTASIANLTFAAGKDYILKIKTIDNPKLDPKWGKDIGTEDHVAVGYYVYSADDEETPLAFAWEQYSLSLDQNKKVYFAVGGVSYTSAADTKNAVWSNIKFKAPGDAEAALMGKVSGAVDLTGITLKSGTDNIADNGDVTVKKDEVLELSYLATNKLGAELTEAPTVEVEAGKESILSAELDTTKKVVKITGKAIGKAKVTVTHPVKNTIKTSVNVEVYQKADIKLDGNAVESIEAAFNSIMNDNGDHTITVTPGTIVVPTGKQLKYKGTGTLTITGLTETEYGADVIIKGNPNTNGQGGGKNTVTRELLLIDGNGNLVIENVSLVSTYSLSSDCQSEVICNTGTGKIAAYNCTFSSHQDTTRTEGKAWFYHCAISGDVDFLWMEQKGVVALYEDCLLTAVSDRTNKAYFTAPRAGRTAKVGKGLVVLNSKLFVQDGLTTCSLFRSPWNGDGAYYNQAAFINSTVEGTLSALVVNKFDGDGADNSVIGWKIDSALAANYSSMASTVGTVSDDLKAKEYAGRNNIINRVITVSSAKFGKDSEANWDVNALAASKGWNVTADTSKDRLDDEDDSEPVVYLFDGSVDQSELCVGFAKEDNKTHYKSSTIGATITVPLTAGKKYYVTVSGYYRGSGAIKAGSQGEALYDFNNGSTSKFIEKSYAVYDTTADKVVITAAAETYITKIVVEEDKTLTFVPVTAITVSSKNDATEVASKKTLQFSYTLTPSRVTNDDVVWSITAGSDVAEIDQKGLLTAGSAAEDTEVTVRVTSKDANAVYCEKTITVKQLQASAASVVYFKELTEYSASGDSDSENLIAADAVFSSVFSNDAMKPGELKAGDIRGIKGGVYIPFTYTSGDGIISGGTYAVATFRLTNTSDKAFRVANFAGKVANSGTGNFTVSLKAGTTAEEDVTGTKTDNTSVINKDLTDVMINAGESADFVLTVKATNKSNKNLNIAFGEIVISGEFGNFPIAGQSYSWNLVNKEGTTSYTSEDEFLSLTAESNNKAHGFVLKNGNIKINVAGPVKVSVLTCQHNNLGSATAVAVTDPDGESAGTLTIGKPDACNTPYTFDYTGKAGVITLSFGNGTMYIEGVSVEPLSN